jgi:hypothetical protein
MGVPSLAQRRALEPFPSVFRPLGVYIGEEAVEQSNKAKMVSS